MMADPTLAEQTAGRNIIAQFKTPEGEVTGPQLDLPLDITSEQMGVLINELLKNDEPLPYSFYIDENEVLDTLRTTLSSLGNTRSTEEVLSIVYLPQAVFRVRPVTRCVGSMSGHTEPILCVTFGPRPFHYSESEGSHDDKFFSAGSYTAPPLASGSGDNTIRIWDCDSLTPRYTLTGHRHWVLCVSFSPDGRWLASGSMDGDVRIWNPYNGECVSTLRGHKKWVTAVSWEPFHLNPHCERLVSSSKDGTARVWDRTGKCLVVLTGHTASVTCVRWGGEGLIYTASQDRTIKVYAPDNGKLVRTLEGHAHWVNYIALSTDYVLRTGPFDHTGTAPSDLKAARERAQQRYEAVKGTSGERLASASDDFTVMLWQPAAGKKPIARLTGHQQVVNWVHFSPDGRWLASASFDKSLKLWDGISGKFITTYRNHVGPVYQTCWSADSRMLVSGSQDSTLKIWDPKTKKMLFELPGHADEVYSVDWSTDGLRVASGGKDRLVKIWRQ